MCRPIGGSPKTTSSGNSRKSKKGGKERDPSPSKSSKSSTGAKTVHSQDSSASLRWSGMAMGSAQVDEKGLKVIDISWQGMTGLQQSLFQGKYLDSQLQTAGKVLTLKFYHDPFAISLLCLIS